jgi:hypothetical protein
VKAGSLEKRIEVKEPELALVRKQGGAIEQPLTGFECLDDPVGPALVRLRDQQHIVLIIESGEVPRADDAIVRRKLQPVFVIPVPLQHVVHKRGQLGGKGYDCLQSAHRI